MDTGDSLSAPNQNCRTTLRFGAHIHLLPGGTIIFSVCNQACLQFGLTYLKTEDARGKAVLEVGARNVNGSLRSLIEALAPSSFVGIDLQPGEGVDEVCKAEEIVARFGAGTFDLLICTEVLEHVRNWREVVSNFKIALRPRGRLLITTRSKGFPYHEYPSDFWRYEIADMEAIFSDFVIEALQPDPTEPGVFLKAHKPPAFVARNLTDLQLYSMVTGRRQHALTTVNLLTHRIRQRWQCWLAGQRPDSFRHYRQSPWGRIRHAWPSSIRSTVLPFGCIDAPRDGEQVAGTAKLRGWALCDDGVVGISIYLDGRFAGFGQLYAERPDVARVYQSYRNASKSGWSAAVDTFGMHPGCHELTVQAVSTKGATRDLGTVRIVVGP